MASKVNFYKMFTFNIEFVYGLRLLQMDLFIYFFFSNLAIY